MADVLEITIDEGFVKNANVSRSGQGGKAMMYFTTTAKITLSGLNYIEKEEKRV
ncbi:hypothetical protein [Paenibacillus sp. YIM B09110]|uniref:hypothetical protein n=1 Tax=Paenibacillus sp. YIM B09110 TaxID=3126102 RepID=UPI00301D3FDE